MKSQVEMYIQQTRNLLDYQTETQLKLSSMLSSMGQEMLKSEALSEAHQNMERSLKLSSSATHQVLEICESALNEPVLEGILKDLTGGSST